MGDLVDRNIPWYGAYLLLAQVVSLTVVTRVLLSKGKNFAGLFAAVVGTGTHTTLIRLRSAGSCRRFCRSTNNSWLWHGIGNAWCEGER